MRSEKVKKLVISYSNFNLDYNITQGDIVINVTSPFSTKTDLSFHQYNNNTG